MVYFEDCSDTMFHNVRETRQTSCVIDVMMSVSGQDE